MIAQVREGQRAVAIMKQNVDGLRRRRDELRTKKANIAAAPIAKEAALARLDRLIADLLMDDKAEVDAFVAAIIAPVAPAMLEFLPPTSGPDYNNKIGRLLAPRLRELLSGEIEAAYAGTIVGVDDATRSRQLAEVDAEIVTIEAEEESVIRSAASVGVVIDRRHDARRV